MHSRGLSCAGLVLCLLLPAPAASQKTRVVVDPDSVISMTVPASWKSGNMGNPAASVQMSDSAETAGLMVIEESKADFFGWNMTRFLYVTLGQSVAALDLPEVSEIEYVTVDGSPAAKVRVTGAAGGQQFTYMRYAIDAPEHYIQLIFFTLRSAWETHRGTFEDIAGSVTLLQK